MCVNKCGFFNTNHTHFLQEEYILVKQKTSVVFGWVYGFFYFYFIKLQGEEEQS